MVRSGTVTKSNGKTKKLSASKTKVKSGSKTKKVTKNVNSKTKKNSVRKPKNIKLKDDVMQISFKDINDDYCWGKYGDFKVIIMKSNGYMNATKLCQDAEVQTGSKKPFRQWKVTATAKDLINEVSSMVGFPTIDLMMVIKGGNKPLINGTYVHHKLIPHIASWASPKFAVRVADIVNKYFFKKAMRKKDMLIKEKNRLLHKKDDKIDKLSYKIDTLLKKNKKMDNRIKRLVKTNDEIYEQNVETHNKLDIVSSQRVVSTGNEKHEHMLVIISNNIDLEEYEEDELPYDYYALRVMKRSFNQRIAAHKERYPDMEIIMCINYSPNSINLWNRIKKKLATGRKRKITINNCGFNLNNRYTKECLIEDIKKIHNERLDYNIDT